MRGLAVQLLPGGQFSLKQIASVTVKMNESISLIKRESRSVRKAHTRCRLVSATDRHIRVKGTKHLNVGEIAQAAGMSRSTFYTHFAGKKEVVAAVIADTLDGISVLFEEFGGLNDRSPSTIRKWMVHVVDAWAQQMTCQHKIFDELYPEFVVALISQCDKQATALTKNRSMWLHFTEVEALRCAQSLIFQLITFLLFRSRYEHHESKHESLDVLARFWAATLDRNHKAAPQILLEAPPAKPSVSTQDYCS